jgi:hypothetical protein
MNQPMKWTVVRYKAKPERADENQRLSEAVFRELAEQAPAGVVYTALRLADGTFVHVAGRADGAPPLTALAAFEAFRGDIRERCLEPPLALEATLVGSYGRPA